MFARSESYSLPVGKTSCLNDRIVLVLATLLLPLLLMSCADDALTTAGVYEAPGATSAGQAAVPGDLLASHSVLSRGNLCGSIGRAAGCNADLSKRKVEGEFASPLFGLATAPNHDILVADAGAGVAVASGATEIPIPGITDIGPIGRGSMWVTTGAGNDPTSDTGQALYRVSQGTTKLIANLFAFEEANDPDDGDVPDSNPFDVHSLGGEAALVADAGGNDLLRVDTRGNVDVLAVFPDELVSTANLQNLVGCPDPFIPDLAFICGIPMMPAQAVPTSIAEGPDGYYYVGELKGFPAPTGASNIWRVAPGASWADCGSSPDCVKVFDGGFTSVIDLAFGPDGSLYVAELDEQSWIAIEFGLGGAGGTINACDVGTLVCEVVASEIPILTAITFGESGSLWATENALIPGLAEVIEIP